MTAAQASGGRDEVFANARSHSGPERKGALSFSCLWGAGVGWLTRRVETLETLQVMKDLTIMF